jgi:hypothetical protein
LLSGIGIRSLLAQPVFRVLGDLVTESILPGGYNAGADLRILLRTSTWRKYAARVSDTTAMNEIFALAFARCGGNRTHALFASAVAVLEHRTIPVKLLFGAHIDLPLTLESEANFERRVAGLPEHVYSAEVADRDKLQHFFFSAYFSRAFGMNWATNALGAFVEIGESLFVIGGDDDPRDRHANADGARFGKLGVGAMPASCLTPNP